MAHLIAQCVLAVVPGLSLGSKSLGVLLVLLGIGSLLTGASYGNRLSWVGEPLAGKENEREAASGTQSASDEPRGKPPQIDVDSNGAVYLHCAIQNIQTAQQFENVDRSS